MELIDRYLYSVTKNMKQEKKLEVEKELRASILDMLPEDYTKKDMEKVLVSLGNPRKLALNYSDKKHYLIGPEHYANYLYVLKLVLLITAVVLSITSLANIITTASSGFIKLIVKTITSFCVNYINGFYTVFAIVTLVFIGIDRFGGASEQWTIKDLEELPDNYKGMIHKSDPIASLVGEILTIIFIGFMPHLLGWYINTNGEWTTIPLFNASVLKIFTPFILLASVIGIGISIKKLIKPKWDIQLAIANCIHRSIEMICSFFILTNDKLFHPDFVLKVNTFTKDDKVIFLQNWDSITLTLLIIIVASSIWSIVNGFLLAHKYKG